MKDVNYLKQNGFNVDSVMDGNLDLFINEYLKMNKSKNN